VSRNRRQSTAGRKNQAPPNAGDLARGAAANKAWLAAAILLQSGWIAFLVVMALSG